MSCSCTSTTTCSSCRSSCGTSSSSTNCCTTCYSNPCSCTGLANYATFDNNCCTASPQTAPAPCCEAHTTLYSFSQCLRVACNITATDTTFYLRFSNMCNTGLSNVPMNSSEVFFYHEAAGLMQIRSFNGDSYEVALQDPTKAGAVIKPEDCVVLTVIPTGLFGDSTNRCLSCQFVVPEVDAEETMCILNGSGIPIGSTLTFTAEGETGSYVVTEFVSAAGSIYCYKVLNAGSGHTPGTIIDGGCTGECLIPIELITEVDLCELSETNSADHIVVCLNGSPRALVPVSEGDVPVGTEEGGWDLQQLTNLDCCVYTDGCLKFADSSGLFVNDSVVLKDTAGIECFEDAWDEAQAAGASLIVDIEGVKYEVLAFNPATREVTLAPATTDFLTDGVSIIEYPANTKICLGDCCQSCIDGPLMTDHKATNEGGDPERDAVYAFSLSAALDFEAGVINYYLIGYNTAGVEGVQAIDNTYNDDATPPTGKPVHDDRLLIRQKICNPSDCTKTVEIEFNYEIQFPELPAGVRVNYDIGHFIARSATSIDDMTVGTAAISSATTQAGYMDGPARQDTDVTTLTSLGFGGTDQEKWYPFVANSFKDYATIPKFECGNSILWLLVQVDGTDYVEDEGSMDFQISYRRYMKLLDRNIFPIPQNDYDLEGWST